MQLFHNRAGLLDRSARLKMACSCSRSSIRNAVHGYPATYNNVHSCPTQAGRMRWKSTIQPLQRKWLSNRTRRHKLCVQSAMFDTLSTSLQKAWKSVQKDGKLTAENIKGPLKDVRRALLEADVSLPVVRKFVKDVETQALGVEVISGVTPDVQFVKTVNDQLIQLMGNAGSKDLEPGSPQVILMAGLQGVGKTTACGKLALFLQKRLKKVLMVATDVYRPAAIDQLVKLGSKIDVQVFELGTSVNPVEIAKKGLEEGKKLGVDAIIIDTAGRLQVNLEMMEELKQIKEAVNPSDTLLVVDAMTGQEAAGLVKTFNEEVNISATMPYEDIRETLQYRKLLRNNCNAGKLLYLTENAIATGAILTKLDGDSRGGAALSVKEVSGKPIKFVGLGEKLEALEPFYPERMASRVLGMGDMLTLYEKASDVIKEDEAERMLRRMKESKYDFNDFLKQWKRMNSMGGAQIMKLIPGFNQVSEKQLYEAEQKFKKFEAMINSMNNEERENPDILVKSPSRRRRIALGSGRSEQEVQELVTQFNVMRVQARNMGNMMRLGGAGGEEQKKIIEDMIKNSADKVPPGRVRRLKSDRKRKTEKDKSKGFQVATAKQ